MSFFFLFIAITVFGFGIVAYLAMAGRLLYHTKSKLLIGAILIVGLCIYFLSSWFGGNAGWLNVGSLVLGLIAWMLPVANLARRNKDDYKSMSVCSIASLIACAISLHMEISYTHYLIKAEDWSALMDTTTAVSSAAALLVVVTALLNIISLVIAEQKRSKK